MKKTKLGIFYVLALQFLFSCEMQEDSDFQEINQPQSDFYLHEDGFLVFSTNDAFEKTAAMIQESDSSEIKAWEAKLNFGSMQQVFTQGLKIEEELAKEREDKNQATKGNSEFVVAHPNTFKILEDGIFTTNIYRIDLAPLVNKDGIVKVGDMIFQYSYDYLKIIEDGDESKINLLSAITETDKELRIYVDKVSRSVGDMGNARTSFYQKSSFTVVEKTVDPCEWSARLVAELTLATVNVPIYELVCRTCYEENGKPYTCCESLYVRTDRRNYFEGFCYNEVEEGFCSWGGYKADSRYQLMISGTYTQNGVSKSTYRISSAPTSQLRHSIFSSTNTPDADVVDAAITFRDVNNPKGKSVFIGFN